MNTKPVIAVAFALSAMLTSGCASIRARTDVLPKQGWTVYPGAQQGAKDIGAGVNGKLPYPGWMHVLLVPAFVVDLPLGAVFDTLALPYDLYRINNPEDFPGTRK